MNLDTQGLFIFFAVLFVAAAFIGFIVLNTTEDAETKRTFYRWYMVIMTVLGFVYLAVIFSTTGGGHGMGFLVIAIPVMGISFMVNFHRTHFCPKCGRPTYQRTSFFMPAYKNCPYCGTPFGDQDLKQNG